jgi:hypothetical protein
MIITRFSRVQSDDDDDAHDDPPPSVRAEARVHLDTGIVQRVMKESFACARVIAIG